MVLKKYCMGSLFILSLLLCFKSFGIDHPKAWNIDTKNSRLGFSVIQDKSKISGTFNSFTGEINADPDHLKESRIKIIVDMNSISTSFREVAINLKSPDWFNVKIFPQAVFTSTALTKTGDKTYQAKGTLTVRDKSIPILLNFILEKYSDTEALVKGSGVVKRTDLGLGKGEWSKTDSLKNDVNIDFVLSVRR
jgi:polyisoprenoid-binding protein YceI